MRILYQVLVLALFIYRLFLYHSLILSNIICSWETLSSSVTSRSLFGTAENALEHQSLDVFIGGMLKISSRRSWYLSLIPGPKILGGNCSILPYELQMCFIVCKASSHSFMNLFAHWASKPSMQDSFRVKHRKLIYSIWVFFDCISYRWAILKEHLPVSFIVLCFSDDHVFIYIKFVTLCHRFLNSVGRVFFIELLFFVKFVKVSWVLKLCKKYLSIFFWNCNEASLVH